MKLKKKEDQSVITLVLLRRGIKILMGEDTKTKYGGETGEKTIQKLPDLGNPSHIQSPNPDTIVDTKNCMLTEA